jgi:phosphoribosylcarboxyaminoimidazole (NCAIR) mutase
MATTTFTSYINKNVGTAVATVVTAGAGAQTNLIGMTCANTTNTAVTVSVYVTKGGQDFFIVRDATVPAGGTLVPVGGDQKMALNPSDVLRVTASTATCIDVITSALVVT